MEDINNIIAQNLKALRKDRKISLDEVAKLSGVSKSMLGQIERSEANPSISTIWKIADGLKVPLAALTDKKTDSVLCKDISELEPIYECKKKCRSYFLHTLYNAKRTEVCYVEIDEGAVLKSDPRSLGGQICLTVYKGSVTLSIKEGDFILNSGMSLQFSPEEPYSCLNSGSKTCKLHMVISYDGN